MLPRILITGATAAVGSSLIKRLAAKGVEVRAAVHRMNNVELIKGPTVEVVTVDYGRNESLDAAFKGIETVYLLTPLLPEQVGFSARLVDAAKKAGVRHIVRQSAIGADSKPGVTVSRQHRDAERYIEASRIPFTHLRPNFLMQNFFNYSGISMVTHGKIYLPLATAPVSYVDARDVAAVAAEVLTGAGHEGKRYTLTGPAPLNVYEAAGIFTRATGVDIRYVEMSEGEARIKMKAMGMTDWTTESLMELYGVARAGAAAEVTDTVWELTGKRPCTFEEFVTANLSFFGIGLGKGR